MDAAWEERIRQSENGVKAGWDEKKQRWSPHDSVEGGTKTIAYGHKCSEAEQKEWTKDGLTEEKAEELFQKDLTTAKADAAALMQSHHVEGLSDKAVAVVTEMAYNMGKTKLNGFSKMWAALAKKPADYKEAAKEMKDSNWYNQVKTRGVRMVKEMEDAGK